MCLDENDRIRHAVGMILDPIIGYTSRQLSERHSALGITPERARRLQSFALRYGRWPDEDTTLSPQWLRLMRQTFSIPELRLVDRRKSTVDGFEKILFESTDGVRFESVLIPLLQRPEKPKAVVCVSSQAGCAMGCAFCATGRMGFSRNLSVWELVAQVAQIRRLSPLPIRGVVFMGMGEPLLNYDAVAQAASIFSEPSGLSIAAKAITISTAGIIPGIRRLALERRTYRLIVSLTAASDEKRKRVMPVEAAHPLQDLRSALAEYHAATGRRITLAWTLISGFNTDEIDARDLANWVGDLPVQIDMIDVNDDTGRFAPPDDAERNRFRDALRKHLNAPVIRRYSGGKDIQAACGMLAAKVGT